MRQRLDDVVRIYEVHYLANHASLVCRLLAALLASPPFTMRLDMTDGQVVEVIATWAVLVFSRFLYIFCPLVFGLPDHLQHSLQLPGWGPLGCLWRRLPRVQQSLQRSARWPLVTNWVLLAVAGGAFLAASDGRPTTHRLFGWKNVTVICNAVAEVFDLNSPNRAVLTGHRSSKYCIRQAKGLQVYFRAPVSAAREVGASPCCQ